MPRILPYLLLIAICGSFFGSYGTTARPSNEELRPLLNSERIKQIYGSYGIEVLTSQPLRVSNLYSHENGKRICRTLAIVSFHESIPEELSIPLQAIEQGSSLGATLKEAGWVIEKHHQFFGELATGNRFRDLAALDTQSSNSDCALHIYVLWVIKEKTRIPFSTIAEIHHPNYLKLKDLEKIYAKDLEGNLEADKADLQMIEIARSATEY